MNHFFKPEEDLLSDVITCKNYCSLFLDSVVKEVTIKKYIDVYVAK